MTLWDLLFNFFAIQIFSYNDSDLLFLDDTILTLFGAEISLNVYLSFLGATIAIIIILVLCCLFIKKIVSLVGGLIRQ